MDIFIITLWTILILILGMGLGSFITFYLLFKKRIKDENNK
jgi:uncharacterized protein YneF (UPF0154 family)